jgi:hypothetical protein
VSLPAIAPVVWYEGKEWIVAPDRVWRDDRLGGNVIVSRLSGPPRPDWRVRAEIMRAADLLASLDRAPSQAVWDVLRVAVGR